MRIVLTIALLGGWALLLHFDVVVFLWDTAGVRRRSPPVPEAEIDALVAAMSLEEKVAQMHGVGQMRGSVNRRLDVPALLATDGPHGVGEAVWRYLYRHTDRATAFPVSAALASSWNPSLVQRVAGAIAREARAKGRNWLLAPALDIVRDPRAGRAFEGFGEDPHLSGRLAVAYVRGVQEEGVVATPKHFVCHNQESFRRGIDVRVGERALREIYLPPFEDAVVEGEAWSIMAASHSVNGLHCTEHPELLGRILKGEWGFRGFVVSDWNATVSTASSLRAGLDMEMEYGVHYGTPLLEAVRREQVAASRLDDAVRRILRTKLRAGLFERAAGLDPRVINSPEHR